MYYIIILGSTEEGFSSDKAMREKWQYDTPYIAKKNLPSVAMHSMNYRFDSFACAIGDRKSKKRR
jgi:hypothetical protein